MAVNDTNTPDVIFLGGMGYFEIGYLGFYLHVRKQSTSHIYAYFQYKSKLCHHKNVNMIILPWSTICSSLKMSSQFYNRTGDMRTMPHASYSYLVLLWQV